MQTVKIGSKWSAGNRVEFVVTEITTDDVGTWIHYNLIGSDKHFNCLIDAFRQRFFEEVNS